jgi:hypothetical protein
MSNSLATVSVKKNERVVLKGVDVFRRYDDNELRVILLTDADGRSLEIQAMPFGQVLKLMRPAPPELVKRFRLTGRIGGHEIAPRLFATRAEADAARDYGNGVMDDYLIEEIEVEPEETEPEGAKSDIPF